jgi:hypothetical protein
MGGCLPDFADGPSPFNSGPFDQSRKRRDESLADSLVRSRRSTSDCCNREQERQTVLAFLRIYATDRNQAENASMLGCSG